MLDWSMKYSVALLLLMLFCSIEVCVSQTLAPSPHFNSAPSYELSINISPETHRLEATGIMLCRLPTSLDNPSINSRRRDAEFAGGDFAAEGKRGSGKGRTTAIWRSSSYLDGASGATDFGG